MSDFTLSAAEFRALYERLRRASAQGPADRRGALNNISSAEVVAAASDVRDGRTVSLAAPIDSVEALDNPDPAVHQMTHWGEKADASGLSLATDRLTMNIHGDADSHIDALCHVIFDGRLSNRVGHRARRRSLGAWDAAGARAGLHPAALELLAERRVAVLGSDGNNDTAPSAAVGVDFPVHVLAINAMGLHLLDYLDFDPLAGLCEELRRWSFLCVVAPLRLREGTGSPVNPIALF
jgi:hypothetical protein